MAKSPLYVIAVDGSAYTNRAISKACELAKATGASLMLVHIIDWSPFAPLSVLDVAERPIIKAEEEKFAKTHVIDPALKECAKHGMKADSFYTWGSPAKELNAKAVELGASMIIMGRRGHSVIGELIMGSVAHATSHHSTLPVLLVP